MDLRGSTVIGTGMRIIPGALPAEEATGWLIAALLKHGYGVDRGGLENLCDGACLLIIVSDNIVMQTE